MAVHASEELRAFPTSWRALSDNERADLAQELTRIHEPTGHVRRWQNGQLIGIAEDHCDGMLPEACGSQWSVAARVISIALERRDPANSLSDLLFSARLQALIATGEIEADGPQSMIRSHLQPQCQRQ